LRWGNSLAQSNNVSYKIAKPEKALLDFLYFRKDISNENDLYELRINEEIFKEKINKNKMIKYLTIFDSKKLKKKIKILNKLMDF